MLKKNLKKRKQQSKNMITLTLSYLKKNTNRLAHNTPLFLKNILNEEKNALDKDIENQIAVFY